MVTMVTKQKIFDQLYFYETFKDEPIPHKNFTFLRQGSYEIPGGVGPTLLGIRCGSKTLRIRRVNQLITWHAIQITRNIKRARK